MVRKPIVQIINTGESILFDVAASRTIHFDYTDLDSVAECKEELKRQIHSVEKDPSLVDTPISVAIDLQTLRRSTNPLEKSIAEIASMVQELRVVINKPKHFTIPPKMLSDLEMNVRQLSQLLTPLDGQEPNKLGLDEARRIVRQLEKSISAMNTLMVLDMIETEKVSHPWTSYYKNVLDILGAAGVFKAK